jgi:hypothetical protein
MRPVEAQPINEPNEPNAKEACTKLRRFMVLSF